MIIKGKFPIKVKKKSGKPFKSGKKINTAVGIVINEDDPKQREGYTFMEDNSVVNIEQCEVVKSIKYIPGDLVEYKGKIYKIFDSSDYGYYVSEFMSCYMEGSEFSPIPLTLEILKKNGWSKTKHRIDEDNFEWYVYENPEVKEIVFQYYPEPDIDMFSTFYYGDQEMIQINYIHELQHLLFGLGIDYKIDI